jgi:hypothetical protein
MNSFPGDISGKPIAIVGNFNRLSVVLVVELPDSSQSAMGRVCVAIGPVSRKRIFAILFCEENRLSYVHFSLIHLQLSFSSHVATLS